MGQFESYMTKQAQEVREGPQSYADGVRIARNYSATARENLNPVNMLKGAVPLAIPGMLLGGYAGRGFASKKHKLRGAIYGMGMGALATGAIFPVVQLLAAAHNKGLALKTMQDTEKIYGKGK